jgi:hypothetical protein
MDANSLSSNANVSTAGYDSSVISNQSSIIQSSIPRGIINNDQGYINNTGVKTISQVPSIYLAYLTNVPTAPDADVVINLNPVCLTFCDFLLLFFRAPGMAFYINGANANSTAITFNEQSYESTQSKCVQFSLTDQVKKAWSKKYNKSETTIPADINIFLSRMSFLTKGLAQISAYVLGLSFDEVLSSLISSKEIDVGTYEDKATVKFLISFKEHFAPLNITILVNFLYVVQIPCFKNVNECDNFCNYYSGDKAPCRKCFEDGGVSATDLANFQLTSSGKGISSNDSVVSDSDSFVFSEISKLIKEDESTGSLW